MDISKINIPELQSIISTLDSNINWNDYIKQIIKSIKIYTSNSTKKSFTQEQKLNYFKLPIEQLVEELKLHYPKLFRKYPHIIKILQTFTYGEDKRILLDEQYRISRSTDRKMILCLFDKYKSQRNNLDLVEAIFAPNYSSLSDAMTTDYPMGKMKNLENFLKQKEEIFFRN